MTLDKEARSEQNAFRALWCGFGCYTGWMLGREQWQEYLISLGLLAAVGWFINRYN